MVDLRVGSTIFFYEVYGIIGQTDKGEFSMESYKSPESLWVLKESRPDTRLRFMQLGKITFYPKGHLCLRAQEDNTSIFFVLKGKVQIYNLTKCGKKKILFILGKDNIANESLVESRNTIFCETIERCCFYVIQRELLLSLMEEDFQLTKALLQYQERKIWRLEHQLKNTVGSIYLERKLASKLWKLARDFGIQTEKGVMIDMDLSITFLADLLGAPRETTSRVCRKLTDCGLILIEKKKIYITNAEKIAFFYKYGSLEKISK